jgi:hypothetical protein
MTAKLRSAEAWLTPFLALKFEIEAFHGAMCSDRRIAAIQLMRVSAVAPRSRNAAETGPISTLGWPSSGPPRR